MPSEINLEKSAREYHNFLTTQRVATLATLNSYGHPFLSVAPFVLHENNFYIYISAIAEHYKYLEKSETISLMLTKDVSESRNMFALERVSFICEVSKNNSQEKEIIFNKFSTIHGNSLIKLLRTLDFSLFKLSPKQGRYVQGFGMAFDTNITASIFSHVTIDKK